MSDFLASIQKRVHDLPIGREKSILEEQLTFIELENAKVAKLKEYGDIKYTLGSYEKRTSTKYSTKDLTQDLTTFFKLREGLDITEDIPEDFAQFVKPLLVEATKVSLSHAGKILARVSCHCRGIFRHICQLKNLNDAETIYNLWFEKHEEGAPRLYQHDEDSWMVPIQYLSFLSPATIHWDIPNLGTGIANYLINNPVKLKLSGLITSFDIKTHNNTAEKYGYERNPTLLELTKKAIIMQLGIKRIPDEVLTFATKENSSLLLSFCENSYKNIKEKNGEFVFSNFKSLAGNKFDALNPEINKYFLTFILIHKEFDKFIKTVTGKEYPYSLAYGLPLALKALAKNEEYYNKVGEHKITGLFEILETIPKESLSELINNNNIDEYDNTLRLSTRLQPTNVVRLTKLPWAKKSKLKREIVRGVLLAGDEKLTKLLKITNAQVIGAAKQNGHDMPKVLAVCEASPQNAIKIKAHALISLIQYPFNKAENFSHIDSLLREKEVRNFAAETLNLVALDIKAKIDLSNYKFPQRLVPKNLAFLELTGNSVKFLWNHGYEFKERNRAGNSVIEAQFLGRHYGAVTALLTFGLRFPKAKFKNVLKSAVECSKNEELIIELVRTHQKVAGIKLNARDDGYASSYRDMELIEYVAKKYSPAVSLALTLAGYHKSEAPVAGKYITEQLNGDLLEEATKAGINPLIGGSKSALFSTKLSEREKLEIFELYVQRLFQNNALDDIPVNALEAEIILG